MHKSQTFGMRVIFLLLLFTVFSCLIPTEGKGDGIGGWPIGQNDTSGTNSAIAPPEVEPSQSDQGIDLFTLLLITITTVI